MARRIGAEMLDDLDGRLAAGQVTPGQYEARKVEIQELIRKGKDWESSTGERLGGTLLAIGASLVVLIASGFLAAEGMGPLAGIVGLVLAIVAFVALKPKG